MLFVICTRNKLKCPLILRHKFNKMCVLYKYTTTYIYNLLSLLFCTVCSQNQKRYAREEELKGSMTLRARENNIYMRARARKARGNKIVYWHIHIIISVCRAWY